MGTGFNMEDGKYNSIDFAKYLVAYSNGHGYPINMTKLQKLLYIAYGTYLAMTESRLVEEHPQAWPYGPVFPSTRNKLLHVDFYSLRQDDIKFSVFTNDSELQSLLTVVFNTFGTWTASQLTEWSHCDGSPWERTVNQNNFSWGNRIPDDIIKNYFRSIINS